MADNTSPKYSRVLLKLSGEALSKGTSGILNFDILRSIALNIKASVDRGTVFGVVVGGGNIWRGRSGEGMDRVRSDHMGMLGTAINALALQDALDGVGTESRVMSAVEMNKIAEPYIRGKALSHLRRKIVCIFACGTGSPYFSTDSAAALRAVEIGAETVLFAKNNVDGIYTADPLKDHNAKKISRLSYKEVFADGENLAALDLTAVSLCMDNRVPIRVIGIDDPANILRAVMGEDIGTVID
jgi:uridylate kinase